MENRIPTTPTKLTKLRIPNDLIGVIALVCLHRYPFPHQSPFFLTFLSQDGASLPKARATRRLFIHRLLNVRTKIPPLLYSSLHRDGHLRSHLQERRTPISCELCRRRVRLSHGIPRRSYGIISVRRSGHLHHGPLAVPLPLPGDMAGGPNGVLGRISWRITHILRNRWAALLSTGNEYVTPYTSPFLQIPNHES